VVEPLPQFGKYAMGEGHINAIPDIDGILEGSADNFVQGKVGIPIRPEGGAGHSGCQKL